MWEVKNPYLLKMQHKLLTFWSAAKFHVVQFIFHMTMAANTWNMHKFGKAQISTRYTHALDWNAAPAQK